MTGKEPTLSERPATWTCETSDVHGPLYYIALTERSAPPYRNQKHVEAILDIADDGTLAGVELVDDMPVPPPHNPTIIDSQAARIAELVVERDEARGIVRDIFWMALRYADWMALRYADGRMTYAVEMVKDAVRKAYDGGWIGPKDTGGDLVTPRFARDGMTPEWRDISERALTAEALAASQSQLLAEAKEVVRPFAAADRAIGNEPGPFRFDTGTGYRTVEREDLRRARAFLSKLEVE